jgi:hypothetical protein
MKSFTILAIILIAAGVLGLVFSQFSFTKDTHEAQLGPLELAVKEKQTVNIPTWAGVVSIVAGSAMLLYSFKQGSSPSLRK